ncbi:Hachiman antiphage defense system protein HamA [Acinetobacter soli]|uniref:Hachiman antiphage defense system protein HamA n=1 Tax=Acinetobacter soli TaxID=487316 RepID=UPI0032B3A9A7
MTNLKSEDYKSNCIYIVETIDSNGSTVRGTGFSISESYILTASHNIIEKYDDIRIYLSSDNFLSKIFVKASCLVNNETLDVALLKIVDHKFDDFIGLYETSVSLDSEVLSCGYPSEKNCHDTPIRVKVTNNLENIEKREYSFEVSQSPVVSVYDGMSGAPVLYNKKCVGILVVQQGRNTLYAISIKDLLKDEVIKGILGSNGVDIISQDGFDYNPPEHPLSPFKYCINCHDDEPNIKGVDIGFTLKKWNISNFTEMLYDWVIDYSLSIKERANFTGGSRQLFKYAKLNYPLMELNALADLCLHVAIRESYKTIPVMNKIIDKSNKTFSCTHAVLNFDKLELWIGASSVNDTIEEAVDSSIKNIQYILDTKSLTNRFYALTNQIDNSWPYQDKLKRLSDGTLTLEERFDKIIIPVFIMHNSDLINKYDASNFLTLFKEHIKKCRGLIHEGVSDDDFDLIDLRVFCFPVQDILKINEAFAAEINS